MKIKQLYTGCLAEAAYYIESAGEAVVIDPLRDPEVYVNLAKNDHARIKYVLETHFHADFVSGHLDLARATDATIVYGPTAEPQFPAKVASDGEKLSVGNVSIEVLHTPGHTMESACFLLYDETGKPHAIFTGDTLFINDVGRPDLAVKTNLTREDLAGHLYDSLQNKILPLPDDLIVYPGHGAGSACGKNMGEKTEDTLGHQKQVNYALRAGITREAFIREVTTGLVAPPQYFPKNAVMNKSGYPAFEQVMEKGVVPLTPDEMASAAKEKNAVILDTRSVEAFAEAHIPGSLFIGLDGQFASWAGTLIQELDQPIVLVVEEGREHEAVSRLARVGYDNALGYLQGGIAAWKESGKNTDRVEEIDASEVVRMMDAKAMRETLIDVRRASEYASQRLHDAINIPLDVIDRNWDRFAPNGSYLVHCLGGYRSLIAISMMKRNGLHRVANVRGGFKALKEYGAEVTEYHEPITML